MESEQAYVGQRRSYAGALCTVCYFGPLAGTKGDWLGVEWDDPSRGKHNGQFEGLQIFQCRSSSPTAASFLRPSRKPDPEKTLLDGIKTKYAPTATATTNGAENAIEISGKVVEEVGFDRIQKQLSVLVDLKIVLVDELAVSSVASKPASEEDIRNAQQELAETCPNIVELDLGWNVIETWQDVADMCAPFRKLKILKAGGLRLRDFEATVPEGHVFRTVEELHQNECLLTPSQIGTTLFSHGDCNFPSLKTLSLSHNDLESFEAQDAHQGARCPSVTTIILENNRFTNLSFLPTLFALFPSLAHLSLQWNAISTLGLESPISFPSLETLNLAGNKIESYSLIDSLPKVFPNLTSLRISRNPLYESLKPEQAQASTTTSDSTSYYLTLARLPGLKSLNYTTIAPRDREEGEIYYLSIAEKDIILILEGEDSKQSAPTEADGAKRAALARQTHPLYSPLCAKYDREDIIENYLRQQAEAAQVSLSSPSKTPFDHYAPGTLGSRLVDAYFYIPSASSSQAPREPFHRPLPTTISVYRIKSMVARHFSLPALRFKLTYESHEYDPVEPINSTRNTGVGTWDGDDAWARWGDWDVDTDGEGNIPEEHAEADTGDDGHTSGHPGADSGKSPLFITREGHRFKKRETEILDGMRPWGDFLDVDAPPGGAVGGKRRRDVRVRVEPF